MSLSFNPYVEHLLLSASTDKTVKLWDARALKAPMHTFIGHTDDVTGVAWAPFNQSVFASSGADRRAIIWDCTRIGDEQDPEDAEEGPPELIFMHGGHTAKVSDFSWSETEDWVLATVAEDNILQVWELSAECHGDGEEEEEGGRQGAAGKKGDEADEAAAKAGKKDDRPAKKRKLCVCRAVPNGCRAAIDGANGLTLLPAVCG